MSSGILKTHRRNDSGELDVFEAAFYFSGEANEVGALGLGGAWRPERRSLDTPTGATATILQRPQKLNESRFRDRRTKQPSSPGVGKLATLLSSFFSNLTASRKKSLESVNPAQSCKNVEYMERQRRRRRRNSIDHVDCTRSTVEKMKCGVGVLPWEQEHKNKSVTFCLQREAWHGNRVTDEVLIAQRGSKTSSRRSSRRREEDGNESDSSSDLFELKSYAM